MEFHKPKPIHNWRDFLKELGTIALGVGIALAAEQGVEWFHWRAQVTQAREAIATEMAANLVGAINRLNTAASSARPLGSADRQRRVHAERPVARQRAPKGVVPRR